MDEESILTRVQKLVDKAFSTTFEPEKEALLAKADELMMKYSIDAARLAAPGRSTTAAFIKATEPEMRTINYYFASEDSPDEYEVRKAMAHIFRMLAEHFHVRMGGWYYDSAKCVGYPADLDFLQMMFTSVKMHVASTMAPSVNPDLSWEMNLVAMKNVGYKWKDIHQKLKVHPNYPRRHEDEMSRSTGVKFTGVYKKWADANPDEIRNMANPKTWRLDFIQGFVLGLQNRLRKMREETVANDSNLPALLNDKKSLVDEAFYTFFPEMRPHPPECDCDRCHFCRKPGCQRSNCKAARQPVRGGGRTYYRTVSTAARAAGGRAAQRVDLSNPNSRVGASARKEIK